MLQERLQSAITAAKLAGAKILSYYEPKGTTLNIKHKSPTQPVTQADLDANSIIKETLADFLVNDGWLSEEDVDSEERFGKEFVWIVDPLDGTRDFIKGNPEFTVSIGLIHKNVPVLGVIYNPVTSELFWGLTGAGAHLNSKPIKVREDKNDPIHIFVSRSEYARGEWRPEDWPFVIQPCGGSAYKLAVIAAGRAHSGLTFIPKSEWDICAGAAIIQEAGGIVTDAAGQAIRFNQKSPEFKSVFYAHPQIHTQILQHIQSTKSIKS